MKQMSIETGAHPDRQFGDSEDMSDRARITRLEVEIAKLAAWIGMHDRETGGETPATSYRHPISFGSGRARLARSKIRERRLREQLFAPGVFAEPAWDMLLDLYAAHYEARSVSVSSLCIAANVPATTALRWIRTMTDLGLFDRISDSEDGRRIFITISEKGRLAMDIYFDKLAG